MSDQHDLTAPEGLEIAVIGMSGRFPGSPDLDAFWRNLCAGAELISRLSDEELRATGIDAEVINHPQYVKAAALLDAVEQFDAPFFGMTPREAELTDPQQRIFLESCWTALEDAGYDSERCQEQIGVYAGTALNTYLLTYLSGSNFLSSPAYYQFVVGNDKDFLASRVAYKLNLRGPAVVVQTACSTSLVAVHLACQDLLSYRCDMALAGGVAIFLPQQRGYFAPEGGVASPDGHCRTFDARAQGTLFGNGVGVVVLKRLADALASGDRIYAVIKGSAINNDGAGKVGYTAPSQEGQAQVIIAAQTMAGVSPETITYVEAHGTATPLGDPIEVAALTQAFRLGTAERQFCALGSVKTNIGHLDAAAGIAGLIKTVLALHHRQIPPSLHFEQPNPQIDFANSPFFVNTRLRDWRSSAAPLRAGVSSFGMGGTNAHLVLEAAPPAPDSSAGHGTYLVCLSAKTAPALDQAAARLADHLRRHPGLPMADVAYTLHLGRRAFPHRRFVICADGVEASAALEASTPGRVFSGVSERRSRPVVFLFPGQGSQYVEMAQGLYASEETFRHWLDRCAELLRPQIGLDLRSLIYPAAEQREAAAEQLRQTGIAQPALFAVEYALAQLWLSWGVVPKAMIGHSIGEYVAACLAGVFSLEDALILVAARGRLMQQLPPGAMLAVPRRADELAPLLEGGVEVAVINAPGSCVVAGDTAAIEGLRCRLSADGVDSTPLHTSHAFHSAAMAPILQAFQQRVAGVERQVPRIPYLSNVTGTWVREDEAVDPAYWARHLRQPVRFADCVATLLSELPCLLLEVGPGQTLGACVRQHPAAADHPAPIATLGRAREQRDDRRTLLHAVGQLWAAGVPIDWARLYGPERRRRLSLPTYPFERKPYLIDYSEQPAPVAPPAPADAAAPVAVSHDDPDAVLVRLLQQQMEVMAHQLTVLQSDAALPEGS
jgi:acyl transferase domain-containing protein